LSSRSFFARASPSFDSVVTLPIRLHIPDDRESPPGSTLRQMQKQQTTAGGETLSFDCTFDIPVEVAAAVCKYRHDRWKFEWGKPQFTRLDVAIGSNAPF